MIRTAILSITAAAILAALALELAPRGRVYRVLQMLCTLVLAVSILNPFTHVSASQFATALARSRDQALTVQADAGQRVETLSRTYIESQICAYIEDMARRAGLEPGVVKVTLRYDRAGCFVPDTVTLQAPFNKHIAQRIEQDLGVDPDHQFWG